MPRSLAYAVLLPALALAFVGCSDGRQIETPAACFSAPATWLNSLTDAPEQVLISEATPISDCLPEGQGAAHQQEVGQTAVEVATTLSGSIGTAGGEASPTDPARAQAALMAGYLVGAIQRGASESDGIHAALVDRVEAAATNGLNGAGQTIQGDYQRGYEAGLESG